MPEENIEVTPEMALEARERAVARREMHIRALDALEQRKLPRELAEALDLNDEQALERSLAATERAFRSAVEQGLASRLRGDAPVIGAPAHDMGELSDELYYKLNYKDK